MENQNLDQVAWDYLLGSPRDQEVARHVLINAGAAAIFPLVRAGLRTAKEFNPLQTRSVMANNDRQGAETLWIRGIAEPMLDNIYAVVTAIGQPAYDALCRALWEQDGKLKVLAAVVLLHGKQLTERTIKQVQDAINRNAPVNRNKEYLVQTRIFILLSNALALNGDPKHQQLLQHMMKESQLSIEETIERTRNTGLLYLIR